MMGDVGRRVWLGVEFAAIYVGVPVGIALWPGQVPLLPVLWLFAVGCLAWLLRDRGFDRRALWRVPRMGWRWWAGWLTAFVGSALVLTAMAWWWLPGWFFYLPRTKPALWGVLMVAYPVVSVYPQGIVYRGFLFRRYGELFGRVGVVVASAVVFGVLHVVFKNWVAPALTLAGGLMFARVYAQTRSLMLAAAVHAAFGCYAFTAGFAYYFLPATQGLVQRLVGS